MMNSTTNTMGNNTNMRGVNKMTKEMFNTVLAEVRTSRERIINGELLENAIVISSKAELDNYIPEIMRMERTYVASLVCSKKGSRLEVSPQAMGATYEDAEIGQITVNCGKRIITVEGITKYIKLNFKSNSIRKEANKNGIYVDLAKGEAYILIAMGANTVIRDVMAGQIVKLSVEKIDEIKTTFKFYKGIDYTPSDIRTKKVLYMDITNGDTREEKLNELTFGAYSIAKADNKTYSRKDITAGFGRSGQQNAPSIFLSRIGNATFGVLVLHNKITSKLSKNESFDKEQPTWDGLAWGRASYLADVLSVRLTKELNRLVIVMVDACQGRQLQEREGMAKESTKYDRDSIFETKLTNLMAEHAGAYTIYGNPNNIIKILDENSMKTFCGVSGDYNNFEMEHRCLAFATVSDAYTSKTQMISKVIDMPGLKEEFAEMAALQIERSMESLFPDKDAKQRMLSMDEATGKKGYAAETLTKIQRDLVYREPAILKMLAKNSVLKDIKMVDKMRLKVGGGFVRILMDDTELMLSQEQIAFLKENGIRGLIPEGKAFSPAFCRWYKAQLEAYKSEHAEEINAMLEVIKNNTDLSKEEKATDKRRYLAAVEADAKINKQGFFIKYPAPSKGEVYFYEFMLVEEIKEAAMKLGFDKEITKLIIDNMLDTTDGSIVFPASDILKYKLAGMDLDFDGGEGYWEPKLVKYFKMISNVAVMITNETAKEAIEKTASSLRFSRRQYNPSLDANTYAVNPDNGLIIGYDKQQDNGNLGVGPATENGYTFQAARTLEEKTKLLNISIKAMGGHGEYKSVFSREDHHKVIEFGNESMDVYLVSLKDAKTVEAAINNCNTTDEANLESIYKDIDLLFRMFQEMLIDSAKKGTKVPVNFIAKGYRPESLVSITSNFDRFVEYLNSIKNNKQGVDEAHEDFASRLELGRVETNNETFEDSVAELQEKIASYVEDAYTMNMTDVYANAKLSDAEINELAIAVEENEEVDDVHIIIRNSYNSVVGSYVATITDIDEMFDVDPAVKTELKDIARSTFKYEIGLIDNLLNQIVRNLDLVTAGKVVKAASIMKNTYDEGEREIILEERGTNGMPYSLGYKYALAKVLDSEGVVQVGSMLIAGTAKHVNVGDVLEFRNGAAITSKGKRVMMKGEKLTGTFTIAEEDGTIWAVQAFDTSMIERTEIDWNSITVKARKSFDIKRVLKGDVVLFDSKEAKKGQKYDSMPIGKYEDLVKILGESAVKLVPVYEYEYEVDGSECMMYIPNCIVAALEVDGELVETPVGTFACETKTTEEIYNGVYGTVKDVVFKHGADDDTYATLLINIEVDGQTPSQSYFDWKEEQANPAKNIEDSVIEEEETISSPAAEIIEEAPKAEPKKEEPKVESKGSFKRGRFSDKEEEISKEEEQQASKPEEEPVDEEKTFVSRRNRKW